MKNKQFSVLNNRGHNQRRLCKMHKQAFAMVSALTMLFTTATVLPYSNFNIVGEITASAEDGVTLPTTLQFGDINIIEDGEVVNASGETWNYDASTNTINITADTTVSRYTKCIIGGAGTVKAITAAKTGFNRYGIFASGKMHISGVTLNVECDNIQNSSYYLAIGTRGELIIENAVVTALNDCESGKQSEPCPVKILGNSIVNINSSNYGLSGSEFTFSDAAHVKIKTANPYVIGNFNYTPEQIFLTDDQTNDYYWRIDSSASFKDGKTSSCAGTSNANNYFEYIGANHLQHTQNSDGETHKSYCTDGCINDAVVANSENCSGGTATCTDKATCTYCGNEYGSSLGHSLQKTESKAPTCAEVGNTEYWQCSECGKYFSDEACTKEITLAQTVVNPTNHPNAKKTEKVEPTCTENGNIEYWYCSDCDKYFSDEACTKEITLAQTVLNATNHPNVKTIEEVKPTCTEDGHNQYAYCPDCDTYFRSRYQIGPNYTTLPEYQIIDKLGHDFGEKYEYDKESHWKACTRCADVEKEEHTFVADECSVCGLNESYINAQFSVSGNMNFDYSESSGNWKKDATLENDGYTWNEDTKTLTLGNIFINGNLILPYDGGLNTIVIADGTNPIVSGNITFSPYQTSLTVKGNGTLTAGFDNGNVGSDNVLTITGGAEVITDFMMWSTNGGIAISDGGKLNVSEYIFTEKITMDKTAKFEIDPNVGISCYENVENGFADIQKYIPSGYKFEYVYIDGKHHILPKNTYILGNDAESVYFQDENGNPITDRVTVCFDGIGEHLAGHSISLDGNIGVNFYMELDESVIDDKDAYMQFKLANNKEAIVYVKDAKTDTIDGKEYRIFSCNVAPKEITDIITAQIITSDGIKGKEYTYTVEEYAKSILNDKTYDDATKNLVGTIMNYGEMAFLYFNKMEIDIEISDEVTADSLIGFEKKITGNLPDGIKYYGSSLLLESNTTVRHYFKVANGVDVSSYGFKKKNGYYYKDITNIFAANLGKAQNITIDDWSISYSPMSYVYSVLESDSADENLKNLCKALYLYQQAAAEYQNK